MRLSIIFLTFFTLYFNPIKASHIVGGEMYYECLGNNQYAITVLLYRDCGSTVTTQFNVNINMTVYKGNGTTPFAELAAYFPEQEFIDPNENSPCVIVPDNICVEQAKYRFEVELPTVDETYHLSYQVCCRNEDITNIINSGQSGSTYSVEITKEAQQSCNSSPQFNNFPPIVICVNEPLFVDHSALDIDGDQLVYSLCPPFLGGSNTVSGLEPDPDEPPPYSPALYNFPSFTSTFPLGETASLSIDPFSGMLTGIPDIQGQYAVGVCVEEYKNGQLLSTVKRDFLFNVITCEPVATANIESDELLDDGTFLVKSCGDLIISFINESVGAMPIESYHWSFDVNGNQLNFTDENVTVEFPSSGIYSGYLIVNENSICPDTAFIQVNIAEIITPNFNADFDSCKVSPIQFNNLNTFQDSSYLDYFWDFGDNNNSNVRSPIHQYTNSGNYTVILQITDSIGCSFFAEKQVEWKPAPPYIIVSPSKEVGCPPVEIEFNNLSHPIDSSYSIFWQFGDNTIGTEISPNHIYENEGLFDVSVEIISPNGCSADTIFPNLIKVTPPPFAKFSYSPNPITILNPLVNVNNEAEHSIYWNWFVDEELISTNQNLDFVFQDTGNHELKLLAWHELGCVDSIAQLIHIQPDFTFFMPNAFTPNNDGKNDFFQPVGIFDYIKDYNLIINNRWGQTIFQSSNPKMGWNGRLMNYGKYLQNGAYLYLVNFLDGNGEAHLYKGTIMLIR